MFYFIACQQLNLIIIPKQQIGKMDFAERNASKEFITAKRKQILQKNHQFKSIQVNPNKIHHGSPQKICQTELAVSDKNQDNSKGFEKNKEGYKKLELDIVVLEQQNLKLLKHIRTIELKRKKTQLNQKPGIELKKKGHAIDLLNYQMPCLKSYCSSTVQQLKKCQKQNQGLKQLIQNYKEELHVLRNFKIQDQNYNRFPSRSPESPNKANKGQLNFVKFELQKHKTEQIKLRKVKSQKFINQKLEKDREKSPLKEKQKRTGQPGRLKKKFSEEQILKSHTFHRQYRASHQTDVDWHEEHQLLQKKTQGYQNLIERQQKQIENVIKQYHIQVQLKSKQILRIKAQQKEKIQELESMLLGDSLKVQKIAQENKNLQRKNKILNQENIKLLQKVQFFTKKYSKQEQIVQGLQMKMNELLRGNSQLKRTQESLLSTITEMQKYKQNYQSLQMELMEKYEKSIINSEDKSFNIGTQTKNHILSINGKVYKKQNGHSNTKEQEIMNISMENSYDQN